MPDKRNLKCWLKSQFDRILDAVCTIQAEWR